MSAIPATDRGITDPLDPWLGARFGRVLEVVDERAGVRVDDTGITVRGLLRTHHFSWTSIERITFDNRLDVLLAAATRLLPVRRVPVLGGLLTSAVQAATASVTRRIAPEVRERAGWVVARIHRAGLLRQDIAVEGGAWLTAVLSPAVSEAVQAHAAMRHVPVEQH